MTTKPLKILIGADTYPPDVNGAAQFGHRLALGMKDRGHEVHVIAARTTGGASYDIEIDGIREHRLRSHHPPTHPYFRFCFPWEMQLHVGRILDQVKPDVVHIQCHYIIGRMLSWECKRRGIRMVATNHFMPENLNPFLPFPQIALDFISKCSWKDMERVLGRAEYVTTPTPIGAKAMHDHGFKTPVIPVSNGIDSSVYELEHGEQIDKKDYPVIFFAGRLAVEKNIDVLIKALSLLPAHLNAHVELAGSGEIEDQLKEVSREFGVEDRVDFLGFVSDAELRAGYLRADIFCQPGTAELQSLVTLEAMSASTPVVLADALALPHLVREGENGYLFEPGNEKDLSDKLLSVLTASDETRRRMGEISHTMAKQHSVEKTWDAFEAMYDGSYNGPEGQ
ncbi:glycosyltransferase [Rothia uropygialis]|uniref:glycosyltransferase n=1 Tax=Kocuria sp. 36 TaxID=1415402 RepID=UPI00101C2AB5|nr:glycosyltransferase [Kocuria sp. 36]